MIGSVMMYLVAVSVVFAVAAWLADEGLRRVGVPTRWLRLGAVAAPVVLVTAALFLPERATAVLGGMPTAVIELPGFLVDGDESTGFGWSGALLVAWLVTSLTMVAVVVRAHVRLASERRSWPRESVDGRAVFVSPDRGPAAAGMLRPWIVLPRWILDLPDAQRTLVLLHEEEHLRGGDTLLLPLGLAFACATPWNPITWWQLGRMRTAMEVDCDRRVLRKRPEPAVYGDSLLIVASRASDTGLALAAFSERPDTLHRRILAMTDVRTRWTSFRAALLVLAACAVAVQACGVEGPVGVDESGIESIDGAVSESRAALQAGPSFTPFTVAPSIQNRSEVIRVMTESYPPDLRDLGIGGTVKVFFLIDEEGVVDQVRLDESSGNQALDDAAMNVAGAYRFAPARNGDTPVPVWVSFPITFQVR